MTIKFDKTSGNEWLRAPDDPALIFPDAEWSLGFVLVTDGTYSGTDNQVLISTGALTGGALNVSYLGSGHGTANSVAIQVGSSSTLRAAPNGSLSASSRWLVVLHRNSSAGLTFKLCPVLSSSPIDGSQVASYALSSVSMTGSYDGPSGLTLGGRADNSASRLFDSSLARVFRIDGALTDLEIARLAYGESIADLGRTPAYYFRMNDPSDILDLGSSGTVLTASGSLSTGGDPQFGYSAPVSPSAPAFTTNPTIDNTPVVGVSVSFTSGTVTGSPTPTLSQQWTLDGADIAGATGATYTPVAGDANKALRVRQDATNTEGGASATSDPVIVAAEGSNTVVEPASSRIFQRLGASAQIALSGTYAGAAASVEARLYGSDGTTVLQDWTVLASPSLSGGDWSGTLTAQQGGMYLLAVRFKDSSGAVIGTTATGANLWGVGEIIACAGSSSAYSWFRSGTYTAQGNVRKYSGGAWAVFASVSNGIAVKVANDLATRLGVPVGMVDSGSSGTTLKQWTTDNSTQWNNFANAVNAVGGKLGGLMVSMGSNDAANGIVVSRSAHLTMMQSFISKVRTLTGQSGLKAAWSGFNRRTDTNDTQANYVRMAEIDIGSDTNVCHFPTVDFELGTDGVHLASYDGTGTRFVYVFNELLAGGSYRRGPKITGISYEGSGATVTLAHRNGADFTPASGITGFAASDASGALTVAAARTDATHIALTFDRVIVSPLTVKYLAGANPDVAAPAFDNGTTALPLDVETDTAATSAGVVLVSSEFSGSQALAGAPVALVANEFSGAQALAGAASENEMSFTPSAARTLTVSPTSKDLTGGPFWNTSNRAKPRGPKDPQAVIDITLDWTPWLADIGNPPIALFTATVANLTPVGAYAEGSLTTAFIAEGSGTEGRVLFKIKTATTPAREEERTVYIDLGDQ